VAVDRHLAILSELDLGQHVGRAGQQPWVVHHLGHTHNALLVQQAGHVLGAEHVAAALHRRGRHTRRHVHEHPQRQRARGVDEHAHALGAQDVADLVRVDHDAGHPPRHHGPRELAGRQQRALDVQVPVDQPRQHEAAVEVDLVRATVAAEADNMAVVDGDVSVEDFVGEQVDDTRVPEDEIRRELPPRGEDAVSDCHGCLLGVPAR
jgi:hypothetical protein